MFGVYLTRQGRARGTAPALSSFPPVRLPSQTISIPRMSHVLIKHLSRAGWQTGKSEPKQVTANPGGLSGGVEQCKTLQRTDTMLLTPSLRRQGQVSRGCSSVGSGCRARRRSWVQSPAHRNWRGQAVEECEERQGVYWCWTSHRCKRKWTKGWADFKVPRMPQRWTRRP